MFCILFYIICYILIFNCQHMSIWVFSLHNVTKFSFSLFLWSFTQVQDFLWAFVPAVVLMSAFRFICWPDASVSALNKMCSKTPVCPVSSTSVLNNHLLRSYNEPYSISASLKIWAGFLLQLVSLYTLEKKRRFVFFLFFFPAVEETQRHTVI